MVRNSRKSCTVLSVHYLSRSRNIPLFVRCFDIGRNNIQVFIYQQEITSHLNSLLWMMVILRPFPRNVKYTFREMATMHGMGPFSKKKYQFIVKLLRLTGPELNFFHRHCEHHGHNQLRKTSIIPRNENPKNSPRDPPTPDIIAFRSYRSISLVFSTSVVL